MFCKTETNLQPGVMWFWPAKTAHRIQRRQFAGLLRLIALAALVWFTTGRAQVGQNYFPSDPANLYDWRAALGNPSIGAFQRGAAEAGYKLFHLGFADQGGSIFKASYALVNLPRQLPYRLAVGGQLQFFTSPLFQEGQFRVNLSRRWNRYLAVGIGLALRNISYNQENFDLVDPNDPVFAGGTSLWQPDISIGAVLIPWEPVLIGIGLTHLNRPSVSLLNSDIRLAPQIHIGLSLRLGNLGIFSGGEYRRQDETSRPQGFGQWQNPGIGMLQIGLTRYDVFMRSRLRVQGGLSIGYGFAYPLSSLSGTSAGNHEVTLLYEFNRVRNLPELGLPPADWEERIPEMSRIDVVPQFYAAANVEALDIFEKQLVRQIDADIDPAELAKLTRFDVGVLDSSLHEEPFPYDLTPAAAPDSAHSDSVRYSRPYLGALQNLRRELDSTAAEVVLITPRTQRKRALNLSEILSSDAAGGREIKIARKQFRSVEDSLRYSQPVQPGQLAPEEDLMILRPRKVLFSIYRVLQNSAPAQWRLEIRNADDQLIFSKSPRFPEQTQLAWDWRDQHGRIIDPGFYRYYVAWEDRRGQERRSASRMIYARKLKRKISIKVSKRFQRPDGKADKVGIILNK